MTYKAENEGLIVIDELNFDTISTKKAAEVLKDIAKDKKVLIAVANNDENVYKSFRNIKKTSVIVANYLNVYDVVNSDVLIVTKEALAVVEEVFN